MLLKVLLLVSGILAVQSEEIKSAVFQKTFHSGHFDIESGLSDSSNQGVEGGAVVVRSNLPVEQQQKLAAILTQIYRSTPDELHRAKSFQTNLSQMIGVYWDVVINFDVMIFYYQYFIWLKIDNDQVVAFGRA
ncbi:hypothetical protein ILUMI_10295 [Ignelater luminosus]|uniref:Uncharacterized protein n=1 Tax=Ignelater luminosus TaxID=2038154 RepID=A0A8K0D2J0_IGNLU|nr:hypothetical protein ILUMI_10295 [Ignelater luminosus]